MAQAGYRIGVDIGGTFTDAVAVTPEGRLVAGKVSTTPPGFAEGFFAAIDAVAKALGRSTGALLAETERLAHGTTVGINALVTGDVARTALVTTRGHGDAIRIMGGGGRVLGASLEAQLDYRRSSRADPVVPAEQVFEVDERIDRDGEVVVALSDAALDATIEALLAAEVEAVAVAFLWSFANPVHERRAVERLRERAPDLFSCASHTIAPRIGEYPRMVSTLLNAQIGPLMRGYIDDIVKGARARGFAGDVLFGQCAGHLAGAEEAAAFPLLTLQSGPVAGVVGAARTGREMGRPDVIVTDMGGTTLDVAAIEAGEVGHAQRVEVVRQLAYLRKVDVESVGAGGGSIAWYHPDSASLRVGPRSAGARPGPICYGRGGREVTVTDADLVLGILSPDRPLADGLKLDLDAARRAVAALGERLDLSPEACAAGIAEVVDSRMEDLIRRVTVQRGADPRRLVLWAFGGASGAHAGLYGRGIGVEEVVFPLNDLASVFSAYGLTTLDAAHTFEAPLALRTPFVPDALAEPIARLEAEALAHARSAGLVEPRLERALGMKYPLQVHELDVAGPPGPVDEAWVTALVDAFHDAYAHRFGPGTGYREAGAELTSVRVTVRESARARPLPRTALEAHVPAADRQRAVYWRERGSRVDTPIFDGPKLRPGARIPGPAIVEYPHTTVAVRPGQALHCDEWSNLVLRLHARDEPDVAGGAAPASVGARA